MKNAVWRTVLAAATLVGWGLLGLVLLGCESNPAVPQPYEPRAVKEVSAWDVLRGEDELGRLRLLEIEHPSDPVRFYRVENRSGQWLGYVDASGRVYRYPAFSPREEFVGIYPMEEGVGILFDSEAGTGPIEIRPATAEPASDPAAPTSAVPTPAHARKRHP